MEKAPGGVWRGGDNMDFFLSCVITTLVVG